MSQIWCFPHYISLDVPCGINKYCISSENYHEYLFIYLHNHLFKTNFNAILGVKRKYFPSYTNLIFSKS